MSSDGTAEGQAIRLLAKCKDDISASENLAAQLQVPFDGIAESPSARNKNDNPTWQLLVDGECRYLIRPDGARLNIDFTQGKAALRQTQASKDQSLVRGLGLHKMTLEERQALHVVDATAGLGQDGWIIACQGCKTTLLEESPLIAALLKQAVAHAATFPELAPIANNIEVINTRSQDYLAQLSDNAKPDIIYLDPMFPAKKKQAKVKKGMQFLQALLPANTNDELLAIALDAAQSRVVVKRPTGAEQLTGTDQWTGQLTTVETDAVRFDVYHTIKQ